MCCLRGRPQVSFLLSGLAVLRWKVGAMPDCVPVDTVYTIHYWIPTGVAMKRRSIEVKSPTDWKGSGLCKPTKLTADQSARVSPFGIRAVHIRKFSANLWVRWDQQRELSSHA
ncbi:hypothetical protein Pst134EA_005480 [Puccinia striiformis f. sp. tritici]|uniref:hypothetical protein n=1 Tax=Puccinia striiformis f. sp. tritici TaxID=168172 RepID=UPI0020089F25|nr:hypothetical protein Pst134EA_005480 [Puccinia striiformis f. sp. tritici]KAH9462673.1 hypothetical protein Pst134EB_006556 [Puccinia striiformis f. sp. tritici]KAH9471588.1 hypothetical protein Pst134EA_005480 [Puccinia striiformis f. sp. tritici]